MTIKDALNWAKNELNKFQVEGVESSATFLLAYVLDKDKSYIFTNPDIKLSEEALKKFQSYVARRAKHEPVWYITGKIEFFGQNFDLNENVLIPRPETELLIEKVIEKVRSGFIPTRVLDIGTGSGVIIVTLADNFHALDEVKFFASDISESALEVAKRNAKKLGFGGKIDFREGSLFKPWDDMKFDLITANLPYVPEGDRDGLAKDLVDYEPQLALFGGNDGIDIIREFIIDLPKHLDFGGMAFLEIGYEQGIKIEKLVKKILPEASVVVLTDYAEVDRIVIIKR